LIEHGFTSAPRLDHRLDLSAVLSALTDLIVNDELGILVEDRILSSRERSKVLQGVLWMDVRRSGLRDVVRLLHQPTDAHCIPMMKVILSTMTWIDTETAGNTEMHVINTSTTILHHVSEKKVAHYMI